MAGWGDWAQLAVQAYGAYSSSKAQGDAAKSAGEQSAAGTAASNDLLREFYNRDEARNKPFYDGGLQAFGQYQQNMQPQVDYRQWAPDNLFEMQGGVPVVNQTAYANNPAYKQAWDEVGLQHKAKYGGGYTTASNPEALKTQLAAMYQQKADPHAAFRNAPGYQFKMDEGRGQVEASAAARGGLNSGAALKALTKYGQGVADQGFRDHQNSLAALWGGAQTASSAMGAAGQNYGGQMGQNITNGANARAQSTYAQGQAKSQMWNDYGQMAGQYGANKGWWG